MSYLCTTQPVKPRNMHRQTGKNKQETKGTEEETHKEWEDTADPYSKSNFDFHIKIFCNLMY